MKKFLVQVSIASSWLWAAVVIVAIWALAPIMPAFVMAALMAYVSHPVFIRLKKSRVSDGVASFIILLIWTAIFVVLVLLVIPVIQRELRLVTFRLPELMMHVRTHGIPDLENIATHFHLTSPRILLEQLTEKMVPSLDQLKQLSDPVLASVTVGGRAFLQGLGLLFLVPLLMFYFVRDGEGFYRSALGLVPLRWQAWVEQLLNDIDYVLAEFLRGQIAVMLSLAVYYAIGLSIIGLPSAFPIGVITGFLIFIPYVGYAIGLVIAVLSAALHGSPFGVWLGLAIVYGVGQVLEGVFLTPRLVGERVGLHPVALIFALMAFGQILGFAGVLLSVPISAALCVVLKRVLNHYRESELFQGVVNTGEVDE
ncbi:MAG: AI-2E family transporter [Pseudomonadota bacterium]